MAENGWGSYRRGWLSAVVVLVALGLVTAFVFVAWSAILISFLMGGTLVASVHLSVGLAQERPIAELVRSVLRWAVRAGLCVVAFAGYASAIAMGTVWLVLLIALTSPPLVSWLWPRTGKGNRRPAAGRPSELQPDRGIRDDPKPNPTGKKPGRRIRKQPKPERGSKKQPKPEPPSVPEPVAPRSAEPVDLSNLSAEELCLAWRRSFTELQSCTTDEQRLAVIANRHAYLDELERRAPDAFAQWLDSGARAAGNPAKFFSPRTNHGDPD